MQLKPPVDPLDPEEDDPEPSPERRLLIQVLRDAIEEFNSYLEKSGNSPKKR